VLSLKCIKRLIFYEEFVGKCHAKRLKYVATILNNCSIFQESVLEGGLYCKNHVCSQVCVCYKMGRSF
jgi:hypothetical protein